MRYFQPDFTSEDRQVLYGLAASLKNIQQTLGKIMTEDAAVAAELTDVDTKVNLALAAVNSLQAVVVALQAQLAAAQVQLSPANQALLDKADADAAALETAASADVAADTPAGP